MYNKNVPLLPLPLPSHESLFNPPHPSPHPPTLPPQNIRFSFRAYYVCLMRVGDNAHYAGSNILDSGKRGGGN